VPSSCHFRKTAQRKQSPNGRKFANSPNLATLTGNEAVKTGPRTSAPELALIVLGKDQGCQMVCFQSKNTNFGKIRRALKWKRSLYFMTIWNILRPIGIPSWRSFGTFFTFWYVWTKKNPATLQGDQIILGRVF
jgi:hypothetical protein